MIFERSHEFILVALFLSRCGRRTSDGKTLPPAKTGTDSWAVAYAIFFDRLAAGRSLRTFHNSLKATRDQFDSHVDSGRRGWRIADEPRPLPTRDAEIFKAWADRSDAELWDAISPYADESVSKIPVSVLNDLEADSDETEEKVFYGREGKVRAIVSKIRERSPRLRNAALAIHGYKCQVCGFDYEEIYGEWGHEFAEVHHLQELSMTPETGVDVNPKIDMSVFCGNCHRMIHRKVGRVLSLDELRTLIASTRAATSP